jgi:hypothetical protein
MSIGVTTAEPAAVESQSARPVREADSMSAPDMNAFAATLANAMQPAALPPEMARDGVDSELDSLASGVGARKTEGKPAFAAAAEARTAAATAPVDTANSDTDALNPDFRARLGRVITRMHDEFGKDVQLVEGFRTQSRQDFLYDQGRTRPGEVVTWTKSSKHTLGLAADVTINGSYTDSIGFQQLAQVAAQEGLRTLGAKDPGHIELPSHGGAAAWGTPAVAANIEQNMSRAVGIALDKNSLPNVGQGKDTDVDAGVFQVASPGTASDRNGLAGISLDRLASLGVALDQTNSTGQSGDDGNSLNSFNGMLSRVGRSSATGTPPIRMPAMASGGGGLAGQMFDRNGGDPRRDNGDTSGSARVATVAGVAAVAQVASVAQVAHVGAAANGQQQIFGAPVAAPVVMRPNAMAADKVGELLDARDASPPQPLSQVTLNVDNAAGGSDKITVQLRAGAVDTAISLSDTNRADRMSLRVGELQHALEQHGLDATAISVASTGNSSGPGWNPRQGSDQNAQDGRSSLNHRDSRQDADETRQRSRREQQGGRQK